MTRSNLFAAALVLQFMLLLGSPAIGKTAGEPKPPKNPILSADCIDYRKSALIFIKRLYEKERELPMSGKNGPVGPCCEQRSHGMGCSDFASRKEIAEEIACAENNLDEGYKQCMAEVKKTAR